MGILPRVVDQYFHISLQSQGLCSSGKASLTANETVQNAGTWLYLSLSIEFSSPFH